MGRPPGFDDDDREFADRYQSDYGAFSSLPDNWQRDDFVGYLFDAMFDAQDWSEAHYWHDQLQDYIADQYGEDFDDYFDWDDWRDAYDAA